MGKERQRTRPAALDRLRVEIGAADRFITLVTWSCAAGMVLWSMLNATPYVRAHVAEGWENTAFVLPLVVDAAFVGALRADEIASRHGVKAGVWPVLLRLFTGASSVFLNIGGSWEKGDWTGVYQHLIAPGLLVLLAEAGPAWRRSLSAKLTKAEREAELEEREQADRARRQRQEDEDRQAASDRQEQERQRLQRLEDEERERRQKAEDEERALDLEERREASRAKRTLEARRLDLEEKRITTTADQRVSPLADSLASQQASKPVYAPTANGTPAAPVRVPVAPVAPAPHPGVWAPQARTGADNRAAVAPTADLRAAAADRPASTPAPSLAPRATDSAACARPAEPATAAPRQDAPVSVAAAQTTLPRVTARLDNEHQEQPPAKPAGPVKDWNLPGLPAEVRPGIDPVMLTDEQSRTRIRYGLNQGWTQRRIGEFAGRSATTVNKVKASMEFNA
ncbi:hypothetical protein [Streptomyces halstedii]|uniref:DUF2637 domain-containing protein n=1 Tax=Streptomyces halstedii TaxID=1944 RepID=A0A6N9TXE0_STRHA|nr:hypothetical protein [Streptomyces halstedii]NEA14266.1 hypothetical protein [Streptomyces halstedii]